MAKFEWLAEVEAVVMDEAKRPIFPGEPSRVLPVLEKLVAKLHEGCHNGGENGKDQCLLCRAWRCDWAEKARDEALATIEQNAHTYETAKADVAGLQVTVQAQGIGLDQFRAQVSQLTAERDALGGRYTDTAARLADVTRDVGEAQRHVALADEARRVAEQESAHLRKLNARLVAIAQSMLQE